MENLFILMVLLGGPAGTTEDPSGKSSAVMQQGNPVVVGPEKRQVEQSLRTRHHAQDRCGTSKVQHG